MGALEIRDKPDRRDDYAEIARLLIDSGADPDHLDDEGRSPRTLAPDTMRALLDERDRAVTTAAVAASIMSGLCGENTGSLLASFLATPWMLSRIPMPEPCSCDSGYVDCTWRECTLGTTSRWFGIRWHKHQCKRECSVCKWVAFGARLRQ